jgi:hypothetical protein
MFDALRSRLLRRIDADKTRVETFQCPLDGTALPCGIRPLDDDDEAPALLEAELRVQQSQLIFFEFPAIKFLRDGLF